MKGWKEIYSRSATGTAGVFLLFLLSASCITANLSAPARDYNRLFELMRAQDRKQPLLALGEFEEDFEAGTHKANREYFNAHPELMAKIRSKLQGHELRWRLDRLSHRLVFVPENREEYAVLFERYCHDVISDVLEKTGFDNPYGNITTLTEEMAEFPDRDEGIAVYLVHNLAEESAAVYTFFTPENPKKVRIKLAGMKFLGEVGFFTTNIHIRDDGRLDFVRDQYTIWQNTAENPYTALTVPVEETLHILLREFTEKAIREDLMHARDISPEKTTRIAEDWIIVEEAIVGGCVRTLLPEILRDYFTDFPETLIEEDLVNKSAFRRYRLLEKGIEIVQDLGYRKALELYGRDPMSFRNLLESDRVDSPMKTAGNG